MSPRKNAHTDCATKKAWEENWSDVSVEKILEIFDYPRVREQIEIFKTYLPRDKKILEGGCGLGPYLIYFRRLGYDVVGADYNLEPLEKISTFDRAMPVCCADVLNFPFADSSFGAYLSLGVIEHFTEGPEAAIKEAHRVLAEDGYFIIQVPRSSIFHKVKYPVEAAKRNNTLRRILGKKAKESYWQQYIGLPELSRLLERNGFDVVKAIPIAHEHALMTFSGFFRDKNSYDGANKIGTALGKICDRYIPWSTAAEMIVVGKRCTYSRRKH